MKTEGKVKKIVDVYLCLFFDPFCLFFDHFRFRVNRPLILQPTKAKATSFPDWVHREFNLMFTLSRDKDRRKTQIRFRVRFCLV